MTSIALAMALALGVVESPPEDRRFDRALVDARGLDEGPIVEALGRRLPDVELETQWSVTGQEPPTTAFIGLHDDGDALVVEVITGDGLAFERRIEAAPGDTRLIATVLANMLWSIEREELPPDRTDAEIPDDALDPAGDGDPEPTVEPVEPAKTVPPETKPDRPTPAPPKRPPGDWTVGLVAAPGVVLGLGPPTFGTVVAAVGASLGLDARGPRGLLLGLDVRMAGLGRQQAALFRLRVAPVVGYALHRGAFELITAASVAFEPWWLYDRGTRVAAADVGASPVALGGGARISPGYRVRVRRRGVDAVRLGARVALDGSFVVDDGPRVAAIGRGDADGPELFRLGGLELTLGLEVAVTFGPLRGR